MNRLKILLVSCLFFLLNFPLVTAAACSINGKEVPCDQLPTWFFLMPFIMFIVMFIIFIPLLIFWIKMLLHAIRNQKENKVVWVLVIIFLQILGALIYYFAEKRPNDKKVV